MAKIVFDLDGVLIKSRDQNKNFIWQKNISSDLGINSQLISEIFVQPRWNEIISGRGNLRETLFKVFADLSLEIHPDDFISFWLANDLHWRQEVLEVVGNLKKMGHQLFIATNQDKFRSNFLKDQNIVLLMFEKIIASCEVGACKPSPEFFLRTRELICAGPSEKIIFIDDSLKNIEVAEKIGFTSIHFDPDLEENHNSKFLLEMIFVKNI